MAATLEPTRADALRGCLAVLGGQARRSVSYGENSEEKELEAAQKLAAAMQLIVDAIADLEESGTADEWLEVSKQAE